MPGDCLTHGPPAEKIAGGSDHRRRRINRHSLCDGVTAYTRPPRCTAGARGFLATVVERNTCFAQT
jgi:hypothetical protein